MPAKQCLRVRETSVDRFLQTSDFATNLLFKPGKSFGDQTDLEFEGFRRDFDLLARHRGETFRRLVVVLLSFTEKLMRVVGGHGEILRRHAVGVWDACTSRLTLPEDSVHHAVKGWRHVEKECRHMAKG